MHEWIDITGVANFFQSGEPGRHIRFAVTWKLLDAVGLLPCVEEEQLLATDFDRLLDRGATSLKMVGGQCNSNPLGLIQVDECLERIDRIEQSIAMIFERQLRVVLLGKLH